MKTILYLFLSAFMVFSVTSCKQLADEDGDLLHDLGNNPQGLIGPRFLHQEYNSIDTLAHYSYDGVKMVRVSNPQDSAYTDVIYNGDLVNQIKYNACTGDSISYTRFLTYDPTETQIIKITELKSTFVPNHAPGTPPVITKSKAQYDLSYDSVSKKLNKIVKREGPDVAGMPFVFNQYTISTYEYDAQNANVIKSTVDYGNYNMGVFDPFAFQIVFEYKNYDDKIIPYSLLPFAYRINKTLDNPKLNYWLSANNPEEISYTTNLIPLPVIERTTYTYDPQNYPLSGFNILYDYRPF